MMTKVCEKLGIDSPWPKELCSALCAALSAWLGPKLGPVGDHSWIIEWTGHKKNLRSHKEPQRLRKEDMCNYCLCFFHTFYPRGKLTQKWSSPFWRGKSSRSLGHGFHSYVLLEGIQNHRNGRTPQSPSDSEFGSFNIRHDQNPKIQPPIIKDMENPWESPIDWRIFHDFPWFSMIFKAPWLPGAWATQQCSPLMPAVERIGAESHDTRDASDVS